jgi:hypothetical protein
MRGRVTFEPRADYEAWLKRMYDEQEAKTVAMTPSE